MVRRAQANHHGNGAAGRGRRRLRRLHRVGEAAPSHEQARGHVWAVRPQVWDGARGAIHPGVRRMRKVVPASGFSDQPLVVRRFNARTTEKGETWRVRVVDGRAEIHGPDRRLQKIAFYGSVKGLLRQVKSAMPELAMVRACEVMQITADTTVRAWLPLWLTSAGDDSTTESHDWPEAARDQLVDDDWEDLVADIGGDVERPVIVNGHPWAVVSTRDGSSRVIPVKGAAPGDRFDFGGFESVWVSWTFSELDSMTCGLNVSTIGELTPAAGLIFDDMDEVGTSSKYSVLSIPPSTLPTGC